MVKHSDPHVAASSEFESKHVGVRHKDLGFRVLRIRIQDGTERYCIFD